LTKKYIVRGLVILSVVLNVVLVGYLSQAQLSQPVDTSVEEISLDRRHPLDISLEETIADPEISGNIPSMRAVMSRYGDKWHEEMEKYLELMYFDLSTEDWELVAESQERWLAFMEIDYELIWRAYRQRFQGGSITIEISLSDRYNRYRSRALHLQMLYDYLMTEDVEG